MLDILKGLLGLDQILLEPPEAHTLRAHILGVFLVAHVEWGGGDLNCYQDSLPSCLRVLTIAHSICQDCKRPTLSPAALPLRPEADSKNQMTLILGVITKLLLL